MSKPPSDENVTPIIIAPYEPPLHSRQPESGQYWIPMMIIIIGTFFAIIGIAIVIWFCYKRRKMQQVREETQVSTFGKPNLTPN